MTSIIRLLFILGFLSCVTATNEMTLTSQNVESVIGKDQHVFIKFFTPTCALCAEFDVFWERIMNSFGSNPDILFTKIDCASEPDLCRAQGLRSLPAITYYSTESTISELYIGKLLEEDLTKFIAENIEQKCTFAHLDKCDEKQRKWMDEHSALEPSAVEKLINDGDSDLDKVNTAFQQHMDELRNQVKAAREKYDQYVTSKNMELKWYRAIRKEMKNTPSLQKEL